MPATEPVHSHEIPGSSRLGPEISPGLPTRVVRVFPQEQSLLRLTAELFMETNQEWIGRVYLRMEEEPERVSHTIAEGA